MTTLGVRAHQCDRVLPVDIPSYNYHHPSIQAVSLASVKDSIWHPRLPTLRRMDMDSIAAKLPDEHSRSSTACTRDDFRRATTCLFSRMPERLPALGITETGREIFRRANAPDELRRARLGWSEFLDRCPERYNTRLTELDENCCGQLEFGGYAVRYMRPGITASWRRPLDRYVPSAATPVCSRCQDARSHMPF